MTRNDKGFTLPEVMLSVVILTIIVGVITEAIILGLRTTDATSTRLNGSHDAQLLSVYLPLDLKSATSVTPTTGSLDCPGGELRLDWEELTVVGSTETIDQYRVRYALQRPSGSGPCELRRISTKNGTQTNSQLIASSLNDVTPIDVSASGDRVTLTLTAAAIATDPTNYTYTVSATRRSP